MNELIQEPARWYCRTSQTKPRLHPKTEMTIRQEVAELVYGHKTETRKKNDVIVTEITGQVFHTLTGATSEKSIQEIADRYNKEGKIPEEPKNHRPTATEIPLFDGLELQRTISYKPKDQPF